MNALGNPHSHLMVETSFGYSTQVCPISVLNAQTTEYKLHTHIELVVARILVALLKLSSWCLVIVVWLFLAVPWVCRPFVIVVYPDHTNLLFFSQLNILKHLAVVAAVRTKEVILLWFKYSSFVVAPIDCVCCV